MNYLQENVNIYEVMIVRPFNKIDYCYLIKDEYVNIMTGLTEDVHSNVIGIIPVDIKVEMIGVEEVFSLDKNRLEMKNGQWFRFRKDTKLSYHVFCYDYCNYKYFSESFWSVDALFKKMGHKFDTVELLKMSYTINPIKTCQCSCE
jgi:hypothetical protein